MIVVLGNRVLTISLVDSSQSHYILLFGFVISCIMVFVVRRRIDVSILISPVICDDIVLLLGLPLELIRFQLVIH